MLSRETLPAFNRMDEVQEFDGYEIKDWRLYVCHLQNRQRPERILVLEARLGNKLMALKIRPLFST